MKIYSDTITNTVLWDALGDIRPIAPGVYYESSDVRPGRKRKLTGTIYLEGCSARHTRMVNRREHADGMAATWMDWGWLIAVLYDYEPSAVIGHYESQEHFLATTARDAVYRARRDRSVRNFRRDHAAMWEPGDDSPFGLLDDLLPDRRVRLWTPPAVERFLAAS